MKASILLLFLLFSLSSAFQQPTALDKARSFQTALNQAVSHHDERAVSGHISNFFTYVNCYGSHRGDKRDFTRHLLATQTQGVVTDARDDGTFVHYELRNGNQRMQYQIGSDETPSLPRLLILARERSC